MGVGTSPRLKRDGFNIFVVDDALVPDAVQPGVNDAFLVLVIVCVNDSFVCVGVGIAKAIFLLFWTFSFPSILTAASKSPNNRSRQKIKRGRWTPILVERYLTWCSYQCTVWDVRFLISTEVLNTESGRLITMFLLIFHLWQIMNILRLSHSGGNATLVHVLPPN